MHDVSRDFELGMDFCPKKSTCFFVGTSEVLGLKGC
jgi:hypothetical protein